MDLVPNLLKSACEVLSIENSWIWEIKMLLVGGEEYI